MSRLARLLGHATPFGRASLGRYSGILLLVLLVACGPAVKDDVAKPPVEASSSVDRAVATTGDVISYTLAVEHAEGLRVEIPETGSEIAGFRIVDSGRETPAGAGNGRVKVSQWYRLRADLVGSYVLPAVTVRWRQGDGAWQSVATSEIFVEVQSVLPADGEAEDIRDVKPLEPPAPSRLWIALVVAAVLALSVLVWWLKRRRSTPSLAPPRPAHELAFEALTRLRQTDFTNHEALRRYYFEISEVVRAYVEARFGINATDLTTEEILRRLSTLPVLDPLGAERLRRFLVETDQVKFAAHQPAEAEIAETYERALSFIEETRPRPELAAALPAKAA